MPLQVVGSQFPSSTSVGGAEQDVTVGPPSGHGAEEHWHEPAKG